MSYTDHDALRECEEELRAAQKLCQIYFDIAAEKIGEDEVRRLRDERIKNEQRKISQ